DVAAQERGGEHRRHVAELQGDQVLPDLPLVVLHHLEHVVLGPRAYAHRACARQAVERTHLPLAEVTERGVALQGTLHSAQVHASTCPVYLASPGDGWPSWSRLSVHISNDSKRIAVPCGYAP